MITLLERAMDILIKNRRPYLALNVLFYGLIIALMGYSFFDTDLQNRTLEANADSFITGALRLQDKTSVDKEVITTLAGAFFANLLGGSYGGITFPSFVIPFAGVALGLFRAAQWGIFFCPANPHIRQILIPHIPTLFIEGQAYILAMLGAYIQGRAMFWPHSIGKDSRWKAYVEGVRQTGTIYLFIMAMLLLSAVYGIVEMALLIG